MTAELEKNLVQRVAVGDIFRRKASAMPDREALVERRGEMEIRLTYRELNDRLNQFVRAMRQDGFQKGDRIGLLGLNSMEYLIALYGCAKGGFTAVPMNPGLNPKDLGYIMNHAAISGLIVDDMLFPLVNALNSSLSTLRGFWYIPITGQKPLDNYKNINEVLSCQDSSEVEDVIIEDRDIFEILYTSGTTSSPKGVRISHLSVFIMSMTNAIEMNVVLGSVGTTLMPLFHCAQQTFTTTFFHVGGSTVIFRGFEPATMLQTIERKKIQVIFCLPAMFRALLDHPAFKQTDVSSVSRCVYAMTPMDQRTLEEGIQAFGAEFFLGTGQTECFPSTNSFRGNWQLVKKGNYWGESVLSLDTGIMDDDGKLLGTGKIGEIVWRGPAVMEGYLNNPEATAESRKYGWHHSGDLGFVDEDGQLAFVDRKKDLIKTGGENVPSIKVERVILADPRVQAVAVIGLPHDRWIEAVTAVVVPMQGETISEADVLELCKKELGGFEVPKKVVFVDDLPKTSTGKIQKHIIRQQHTKLYGG